VDPQLHRSSEAVKTKEALERRTAVITGGAGFIGSHLADRLLGAGWRVVALDNLMIGRRANVAHLDREPRFSLVEGDVGDRDAVVRLVQDVGADTIFHLAAVHYIPYCTAHPFEALRINVLGTQAVVDAAAAGGVRRIVFTSTSDVYAPRDAPHTEDDPLDPYTVYGTSKLLAERLLKLGVAANPALSVGVARLFNVYGPRETNPHVLPDILAQVVDPAARVVRLGNLWPRRDFVYVDDVTAALVALSEVQAPFDVFNVATGSAVSIRDLVALIGGILERSLAIETDPSQVRPVERACLHAAIDKASRHLGWKPRWALAEGLRAWMAVEGLARNATR
jgi:UDP-glucose 4-epimerase